MINIRVFVLGLDGATFRIISPLAKAGYLPTFKRIMEEGCWGVLESTIPPISAPAWTSFSTGCSPKIHGIYDFMMKKFGKYEYYYINSTNIKVPFFWEVAGNYGKKVGIINVMVTYPPRPVNGFLITGGLTPKPKNFTHPPELEVELLSRFGKYPFFPPGGLTPKKGEDRKYIERMFDSLTKRMEITRYLARNKVWDLFVTVFEETDALQHAYMGLISTSNIARDAVQNCYKLIDDFLQELIDGILNDSDLLIIMSDHGHGPLRKYLVVNNFLMDINALHLKNSALVKLKSLAYKCGLSPSMGYRIAKALGFRRVRSVFRSGIGESLLNKLTISYNDIDWIRTKAFSVGVGGGIYINLKSREECGSVEPNDYEKVVKWLVDELYSLKDPETGKYVIEKVYRKEDIYGRDPNAPDIIFVTREGYATLHRAQFVSLSIFEQAPSSGAHRPEGIFMAYGNGVKKGQKLNKVRIFDLAPTILHFLGIPIPYYMDGRVLIEIFDERSEFARRPVLIDKNFHKIRISKKIKKLKKRLKSS